MDVGPLEKLLVEEGIRWVTREREHARLGARPVSATERSLLSAYVVGFPSLDDVRVSFVPRLANAPFLDQLPPDVRDRMIDFSAMDAIAFVDTVVARQALESDVRAWIATLIHELAHVAQYAILGVEGFVREYVAGFLEHDFVYDEIPLESAAFALQRRFERGEVFALAREVGRQLRSMA